MAYITLQGNRNIEVSEEEAKRVKELMLRVQRPDTVEVAGHLIKLSSIREVYFGEPKNKEQDKYHEIILEWESEIKERRNYSIPEKISYTRSLMATAWKSLHFDDSLKPNGYIPAQIWEQYEEVAKEFFSRHPKRIYMDSHVWLSLFKPFHHIDSFGERSIEAIIRTIGNERKLAQRDGEPQDALDSLEIPLDYPQTT